MLSHVSAKEIAPPVVQQGNEIRNCQPHVLWPKLQPKDFVIDLDDENSNEDVQFLCFKKGLKEAVGKGDVIGIRSSNHPTMPTSPCTNTLASPVQAQSDTVAESVCPEPSSATANAAPAIPSCSLPIETRDSPCDTNTNDDHSSGQKIADDLHQVSLPNPSENSDFSPFLLVNPTATAASCLPLQATTSDTILGLVATHVSKVGDITAPVTSGISNEKSTAPKRSANHDTSNGQQNSDLAEKSDKKQRQSPPGQIHQAQDHKNELKLSDEEVEKLKVKEDMNLRNHVLNKLKSLLLMRLEDLSQTEQEQIEPSLDQLIFAIEAKMWEVLQSAKSKKRYYNHFYAMRKTLQDKRNKYFASRILRGELSPTKLVVMSSLDMGAKEVIEERAKRHKQNTNAYVRDAIELAKCGPLYYQKSKKGERFIVEEQGDEDLKSSCAANRTIELPGASEEVLNLKTSTDQNDQKQPLCGGNEGIPALIHSNQLSSFQNESLDGNGIADGCGGSGVGHHFAKFARLAPKSDGSVIDAASREHRKSADPQLRKHVSSIAHQKQAQQAIPQMVSLSRSLSKSVHPPTSPSRSVVTIAQRALAVDPRLRKCMASKTTQERPQQIMSQMVHLPRTTIASVPAQASPSRPIASSPKISTVDALSKFSATNNHWNQMNRQSNKVDGPRDSGIRAIAHSSASVQGIGQVQALLPIAPQGTVKRPVSAKVGQQAGTPQRVHTTYTRGGSSRPYEKQQTRRL